MFTSKQTYVHGRRIVKLYSVSNTRNNSFACKLLIVGGGAGGCSVASRLSRILRRKDIFVLEPSKDLYTVRPGQYHPPSCLCRETVACNFVLFRMAAESGRLIQRRTSQSSQVHYYQPMFTLVGSGIKDLSQSKRAEESVLPRNVIWLRDHAEQFDPCNNVVYTRCGHQVHYDYMVIAVGLMNDYEKIPGLKEELDNPSSTVSTIYSSEYCGKVWRCFQQFRGGNAVFTFPKEVGKCTGAAQKIMYLADDYWRRHKVRDSTNITYNTATNSLFGIPKYATALENIASARNIVVNCNVELIEISGSYAVFKCENGQYIGLPYKFLHVTPPMSPPDCLKRCAALVTHTGFLDIDRNTLQHRRYPNIYGIGDCTSTPNSKTASAIGPQSYVVERNLRCAIRGETPTCKYTGYGACPILTSYRAGILAEFEYDKKLCSTFPFDQSKERCLFYQMHIYCFPHMYWNKLLKGKWSGPSTIRKIINPFNK